MKRIALTVAALAFASMAWAHNCPNEMKAIDADVRTTINGAAEFAQSDPEPDPSELWTDVLVEA